MANPSVRQVGCPPTPRFSIWWGMGGLVGACHCPSAAVGSRECGAMTDSPQCSDIEEGSTSGGEYFNHGAAGEQCCGGDALFVAIRGSVAVLVCRQRPQRARRAVEQLLSHGFEPRWRCFVPRLTASGEAEATYAAGFARGSVSGDCCRVLVGARCRTFTEEPVLGI